MIRTLLATTAIVSMASFGAYAQDTQAPAANPPAAEQPADNNAANPAAPATGDQAAKAQAEGQIASNIMGEAVYNGTGDDAENIGDVNDLVITKDGRVESVVVGVGGFLGVGEKNVALPFNEIQWADREGDRWIVVQATKEELEGMPDFDRSMYEPASENTATGSIDGTTTAPSGTTGTGATGTTGTGTTGTGATGTTAPAQQ